jgi:hypothetical protein
MHRHLSSEDGVSMFLQNIGIYLRIYTASQPTTQKNNIIIFQFVSTKFHELGMNLKIWGPCSNEGVQSYEQLLTALPTPEKKNLFVHINLHKTVVL